MDSEFAGIIVAVGFLVLGLVSMPLATAFILGAIALGVVIALLLRFTPKKVSRVVFGTAIILAAGGLWWLGHKPRRPRTVSSNALYVLPNNVPPTLHQTGYWLDCRFDQHAKVDRCTLTDENGNTAFEDVFLPCIEQAPFSQKELVFDARRTGNKWTQSQDKRVNVPIVYLEDHRILLPQSLYAEAKSEVYCYP